MYISCNHTLVQNGEQLSHGAGKWNFLKNQLSGTVKLRQRDFVTEKKYALSRFTLPSSLNPST